MVHRSDVQAGTTGWHGTDADTGAVLAADAAGKKAEVTFLNVKQLAAAASAKAAAGAGIMFVCARQFVTRRHDAQHSTFKDLHGVAATLLAMVCLQKRQRMAGPTQVSRGKIGTGTKASVCSLTMHVDAVPQVTNKVMHQSPVPADYANCAHLLLARSPAQRSRDRDKERGRKRDRSRSRSRERHHSKSSKRQDDHRHRHSSSRHRSDRERGSQEGSPDRRRDRSPRREHGQPSSREASDGAGKPAAVPAAPPKREAVFEVSKNGGKEVGPSRRGHPRTRLSAWRCPRSVVPSLAMPGAGCFGHRLFFDPCSC